MRPDATQHCLAGPRANRLQWSAEAHAKAEGRPAAARIRDALRLDPVHALRR
jgi:hypothetical protein